jgi:YggT family protein
MLELAQLLDAIVKILSALIVVRVLLTWVPGLGMSHPAGRAAHRALAQVTSPIIDPIRRLMPPVAGLDLSPIVAIMLLQLAGTLLVEILMTLGP